VLAGTLMLAVAYPNSFDISPFLLAMLSGTMTAEFGAWTGATVGGASAAALVGLNAVGLFSGAAIWCFALALTWLSMAAVRRQLCTLQELQSAQADLARQAAEDERRRLAREIHDLVAHSLAVTMLHLTGARLALQAGDQADAVDALEQAEQAGRQAMGEIRRTVGLLGPVGEATAAPTPRATDIPSLVGEFRAAGLPVSLELPEGEAALDALSAATGVTLYRAVQEALSNVVKHAPGVPAQIRLWCVDGAARLIVENPVVSPDEAAVPAEPGHGLQGMDERVRALGGGVSAGRRGPTWVVDATVPLAPVDELGGPAVIFEPATAEPAAVRLAPAALTPVAPEP
jgi:signal transduction histidine kinase